MTRAELLELASELPEISVITDRDATDIRVAGKTFAAFPFGGGGTVIFKLTLDQQDMLTASEPAIFRRLDQYLGSKGWTKADLERLDATTARSVLRLAWTNAAPKRTAAKYGIGPND
ncbi:MAG: MmcQ/YjbR family DNA-binding protein [Hyphomicrobiaceae bacterium]|nr:MmcQ/YjbR family DNA-binding protein [Hyphomicrobiaceae bacterium]